MESENRGLQAGIVAIAFIATSWVTVALRVYVRAVMMRAFGIDDYLAVLALALFSLYAAFVLDGVHYGTGRHLSEMITEPDGVQNFVISMKAWWIAELSYVACTTVLKISIGFFLLRVCVVRSYRIIIWVVLSIVTAFSLYYFVIIIFQCKPISYFWSRFDFLHPSSKGSCVSDAMVSGSTYTHSALSAIADWTLGLLPIFLVWDLKMNPRTKVSVAVILALGALGSTATIVRIPYIRQLTQTHDFLYANVDVSIWSTVEPGLGITASALATLKPLFKSFFSRSHLMGSSTTQPSQTWIGGAGPDSRRSYFRSSGNDNPLRVEELGLSGLTKGSVSTTIRSSQDDDVKNVSRDRATSPIQRSGSLTGRKLSGDWNMNERRAEADSSSSSIKGSSLSNEEGIMKTTEITTTTEWTGEHEIGLAIGRDSDYG